MSANQTATHRLLPKIDLAIGPNPPWTGIYFTCACTAVYQLGASDECTPVEGAPAAFETFPCWTCGKRNIVYDTPEARTRPAL